MKFKSCFIALIGFGFLCCKHETKPDFSSSEVFELSPPRLEIDSLLFKNSATLKVEFEVENAKIHYTKDGSEVTENSTVYKEPITIQKSGTFNFKGFHPSFKSSNAIGIDLIKVTNDISKSKITVSPNPHSNYIGIGAYGLVDLKKGSTQFRNGNEWLGFQSNTVTINLDFKEQLEISKVILSTLKDHNSWIFSPESFMVFNKAKNIGTLTLDEPTINQETKLSFIEIPIKKDSYSNLEIQIHLLEEIPNWHQGKGTTPFFFIDEIIVE
jgi:hypothetical protein